MRKRDWSIVFLFVSLCAMGLYHNGAYKEAKCLENNSPEECARLRE